jgi:hypothetical protein
MKLGILNNYVVNEKDEKLLDLHLNQIERHTKVPYAIYATINRLLPQFRPKMGRHPRVKICECPTAHLPINEDFAYYLEHLIPMAIEDGCTHIAILHVDSFPVRSDWAEELAAKLSDSYVFAAPSYGAYTACLFFQPDFYLKYRPAFHLSEEERSSAKYMLFCRELEHIPHCGIGYLFKAYSEGLPWYPFAESNKRKARYGYFCSIYDDLVFHLGGVWTYSEDETDKDTSLIRVRTWAWKHFWFPSFRMLWPPREALGWKRFIFPRHLMSWGWRHLGYPMFFKPILLNERRQLLEDPESYLKYIRTGRRKNI